jgi:c-opsin
MSEDAVVEGGPLSAGEEPLMHPAGYIVSAIALFFIGFFGFFFNLLVIILMFREKQVTKYLSSILSQDLCRISRD